MADHRREAARGARTDDHTNPGHHTTHPDDHPHTMRLVQPGRLDYLEAWALQRELAVGRADGTTPDTLIMLEHPHTYTVGRSGRHENLLWGAETLREQSVSVYDVDRGGDITYHGPGQLVLYPILHLGTPDTSGRLVKADYVGHLRRLEEVIIRTLAEFGLEGFREEGYTGVWVQGDTEPAKIAAIGVRVNAKGVSTHGAALNVDPDLAYFQGIIPCGIADRPVTSMRQMLGAACPAFEEVQAAALRAFADVFSVTEWEHSST